MQQSARHIFCTCLMLIACSWLILLGGCAQRSITLSTLADRDYPFEQRPSAHVFMIPTQDGQPLQRDALSLQQRHIHGGVQDALRQHGFDIVAEPPAVVLISVLSYTQSGQRDTYRTVPVHEHTYGTVDTRRGPRRFHGTTSTAVVVPHRVQYTNRTIVLTASLADSDRTIWIGRMQGAQSDIDGDVTLAVNKLLNYWGETVTRTLRY